MRPAAHIAATLAGAATTVAAVAAAGILAASLGGCASHATDLAFVRQQLMAGDIPAAVAAFEKRSPSPEDLLYLLEWGQMLRLGGRLTESNEVFEAAERRVEDLYTKSISREVLALATTDHLLPYRGMPYEVQFVQYYRALNYLDLGQLDGALVEARKANYLLAQYAEKAPEDGALRQDAFLQYFTGLLYEAAGESNDALVSFRLAAELYGRFEADYGVTAPASLWEHYYAAATRLGSLEEVRPLAEENPDLPRAAEATAASNVVLFLESGFVPFRESVDLWLPILERERDEDHWIVADRYVHRYRSDLYSYRRPSADLSHVLRVAFPRLVEVPPRVQAIEVSARATTARAASVERGIDLAAIAREEFDDRLPMTLARTVARALVKEVARASAGRKEEAFGVLVNVLGVVTERADTRGWILLPGRIDLAHLALPPGPQELDVEFRTAGGAVVARQSLTLEVPERGVVFRAIRCYQ